VDFVEANSENRRSPLKLESVYLAIQYNHLKNNDINLTINQM